MMMMMVHRVEITALHIVRPWNYSKQQLTAKMLRGLSHL